MFHTQYFGRKLARLRKNADMTQSDLAERLNVTRQAISKYEMGDSFPDVSILIRIAEVFNVSTDELILSGAPTDGEAKLLSQLTSGHALEERPHMEDIMGLAPLLRPSQIACLAERLAEDGINISRLVALSEFLSDDGIEQLLGLSDCSDLTPELLRHLLPFLDYDSRNRILEKILDGELDWHLLYVLGVDRSLIEAAALEGIIPDEALWWRP